MALIRISRPGEPTRLIDIGSAYGHIDGQNNGGSIVVGGPAAPPIMPTPQKDLDRNARNRTINRERKAVCLREMATGVPCGRTLGHKDSCRSRQWMDRKAASIRSGL